MENNPTYKLSVIIVNYNVEYFLDQCLDSVKKASTKTNLEVIIVDNNSVDNSVQMVKDKYPDYQIIKNNDNVGFSKANNQAINISKGEYVLLLNPDTVVSEDTFEKVVDYMDKNDQVGGLGIHMVDGKGNFLPESKRGLPTPMVAFYKIFGLSNLFPKSKKFGQYHLGHLSKEENHNIDILSGAFMLMRKTALDKVGLLDEEFFMYGEDIDLSYRIQQGGFENHYFSESSIIHYKGESTKKSSVNYVFVFYNAMIIFAKKHFSGNQAQLFSFLINLAIYLRAFIAIGVRFVKKTFLPFVDFIYIVVGLYALTHYWRLSSIQFPEDLIKISIPIYALTWIGMSIINGGYDFPVKLTKYLKGTITGTVLILVAYAVLPKSWQFSRLFIFVGAAWVILYYLISRTFLHFAFGKKFRLRRSSNTNFIIVGSESETNRIEQVLNQTLSSVGKTSKIENIELLDNITDETDEIIFSSNDNSYKDIINWTKKLSKKGLDFKIVPSNANLFIGSNSIDTAGDLYILNLNNLLSRENQRKKRLFDFGLSFLFLLFSPILIPFVTRGKLFLSNCFHVLIGKKSFIGFTEEDIQKDVRLPKTKPGIISPADKLKTSDPLIKEKLNLLYSRDYSMRKDFAILMNCWKNIGE